MGYILVEDILDEMSKDISYIKLSSYLKGRKKVWFFSFYVFTYLIIEKPL